MDPQNPSSEPVANAGESLGSIKASVSNSMESVLNQALGVNEAGEVVSMPRNEAGQFVKSPDAADPAKVLNAAVAATQGEVAPAEAAPAAPVVAAEPVIDLGDLGMVKASEAKNYYTMLTEMERSKAQAATEQAASEAASLKQRLATIQQEFDAVLALGRTDPNTLAQLLQSGQYNPNFGASAPQYAAQPQAQPTGQFVTPDQVQALVNQALQAERAKAAQESKFHETIQSVNNQAQAIIEREFPADQYGESRELIVEMIRSKVAQDKSGYIAAGVHPQLQVQRINAIIMDTKNKLGSMFTSRAAKQVTANAVIPVQPTATETAMPKLENNSLYDMSRNQRSQQIGSVLERYFNGL